VSYISGTLAHRYAKLTSHNVTIKDSSNMTLPDWQDVAQTIAQICGDDGIACRCDHSLHPGVKLLVSNPFLTEEDYLTSLESASGGLVLCGYGGGNANIEEGSGCSILPMLRRAQQDHKPIILASQVPWEATDFAYEVGRVPVDMGAVPAGSLSPADCQVKLAYLVGHGDDIAETAEGFGLSTDKLLRACFIAGVGFRNAQSLQAFEELSGLKVLPYDPFINVEFHSAAAEVARAQQREPAAPDEQSDLQEARALSRRMGRDLVSISKTIVKLQGFLARYPESKDRDEALYLLGMARSKQLAFGDAIRALEQIGAESAWHGEANALLHALQSDSDKDGFSDFIEDLLGTDKYDPASRPL
jgi:hypothetical protein